MLLTRVSADREGKRVRTHDTAPEDHLAERWQSVTRPERLRSESFRHVTQQGVRPRRGSVEYSVRNQDSDLVDSKVAPGADLAERWQSVTRPELLRSGSLRQRVRPSRGSIDNVEYHEPVRNQDSDVVDSNVVQGVAAGPDAASESEIVRSSQTWVRAVFGIGIQAHSTDLPTSRLVHPSSPFAVSWLVLTCGFLLYTAVVTPPVISFHWLDGPCDHFLVRLPS